MSSNEAAHLWVAYKELRPNYDAQDMHGNSPFCTWKPPTITGAYRLTNSACFCWSPGAMQFRRLPDSRTIFDYRVSSMFWCGKCQTTLHVPFDCTKYNVQDKAASDQTMDWQPLGFKFRPVTADRTCVALVGQNPLHHPHDTLKARAPKNWMGELLPYKHAFWGDSTREPEYQDPCKLSGDLSILFGLMAMSAPSPQLSTAINSLGWDYCWNRHGARDEIQNIERGIVIQIYGDKRRVTKEELKTWEAGNTFIIQ